MVQPCGLFVGREEEGFLGASPDGVIGDDTVIEIKCPAAARDLTPLDAAKNKKINCVEVIGGKLKLKKKHNYMYQIQGQMHLAQKEYCYFVIWTPFGMHVEKVCIIKK